MINQLMSKCRIAEAGAIALAIADAYQSSGLPENNSLASIVARLELETKQLTKAFKQNKAASVLMEKNKVRKDKIRGLFFLVRGNLFHPDETIKTAAAAVEKVCARQGLTTIVHSGYGSITTKVKALLSGLAAPEISPSVALLSGCAGAIAGLEEAQRDFEETYLAYVGEKAMESTRETATAEKNRIVYTINHLLLVYLRAMVQLDEPTYGEFARTIARIIDTSNEVVKRRGKKGQGEEPAG
jgi:hypothetical protein